MDLKQNPFSLYDFLGYFTPGALFLYGLMAAYAHAQPLITVLGNITATLSFKTPEVYIPFILVAYATGSLSFLSSYCRAVLNLGVRLPIKLLDLSLMATS